MGMCAVLLWAVLLSPLSELQLTLFPSLSPSSLIWCECTWKERGKLIPPRREIDLAYDRVRIKHEVVKSQVWTTFCEWWDLVFAV